jgi:predicted TIM-barrel fold metal-dependent hydrolase
MKREFWSAKKMMMEYWTENFLLTTAGLRDEAALLDTIRVGGEGRVMFSVDYPFQNDLEISPWFDGLEMEEGTKEGMRGGMRGGC